MSNMKDLRPDIEELIGILQSTGVSKIEIEDEKGRKIKVEQHVAPAHAIVAPTVSAASLTATPPTVPPAEDAKGPTCKTPMVGTVYLRPSPDAEAFVKEGQKINVGDVICIVEAMKMFNRIKADKSGTIKTILVDDAQPVEFDQDIIELD